MQNNISIPDDIKLYQNYPNPFNPKTIIEYQLSARQHVKLSVYDILGREIVKLVDIEQNSGTHKIEFDGTDFPSSIYFYRLETVNFSVNKVMVLIK